MKRATASLQARCIHQSSGPCSRTAFLAVKPKCIHTTSSRSATPLPVTAHGPPPKAPVPAASQYQDRLGRRKQQASLLKQAKDIRAKESQSGGALRKRFWKDVSVQEAPEGLQIHLDHRPVRTPSKKILTLPHSKPHLASAIALEWDVMTSAQQALKTHLIPLTSIAARAEDIRMEDERGVTVTRQNIVDMVMGYLDTDTLLCWAPEHSSHGFDRQTVAEEEHKETLRDLQIKTAQPIIGYLTTHIWPGVEIKPVLDSNSIMPTPQPQMSREIIKGWISGLPAFELAGLERAVLASKSLLLAVRLLVEWSEEFSHLHEGKARSFGIEEAAEASNLEVSWQTRMWGEVEDTHDVNKEDLRRQLGSVVLLVSGVRSYGAP